jgi:hypothetical protein
MRRQRTLTRIIYCGVVLAAVVGARPSLKVAALAASSSVQPQVDCEEWEQHPPGVDSIDNPCDAQKTFRAEEELSDRRHIEEQEGLRWQPLEPTGRDLSLWYYPGAPRPLWGH